MRNPLATLTHRAKPAGADPPPMPSTVISQLVPCVNRALCHSTPCVRQCEAIARDNLPDQQFTAQMTESSLVARAAFVYERSQPAATWIYYRIETADIRVTTHVKMHRAVACAAVLTQTQDTLVKTLPPECHTRVKMCTENTCIRSARTRCRQNSARADGCYLYYQCPGLGFRL